MCIIVVKPKNVELPSIKTLQNCFENNPDGCGFMYEKNGKVEIKKGYRDFDTFYKDVSKIKKTVPLVMHFRISTQGGVKDGLTHPFPLAKNYEEMRKLKNSCEVGIAHNGVIQLTSSYGKDLDYNDTMTFIKDYASLIITEPDFYKNENKVELLKRLAGSKLAIMSNDGNITLIGEFLNDDGIYYSNGTYKEYYYSYSTPSKNKKAGNYNTYYDYRDYYDWTDDYWTTHGYDFNDKTKECPCEYYGYSSEYYCNRCKNYNKCTSKFKDKNTKDGQ